ncbi:hypothetical protein OG978_01830 [Streptomyces sp. NBC_01591]|nr:hypothetical protein [Streptomyces sp. NBC_01591]WSD66277.1 hypothetical protein OG978_01830 [Streptomyces sp. NBC_01591]
MRSRWPVVVDRAWEIVESCEGGVTLELHAIAIDLFFLHGIVGRGMYSAPDSFADAAALVDEAHAIAAELGTPAMLHVDVTVAAWRGDAENTTRLAHIATRDADSRGEGRLLSATEYARTVLLNGLGRYDAALEACQAAGDLDEISFHSWIPVEFIEAATHAGRRDLAEPVMKLLSERTAASGSAWALGTELRSRALLTEGPAAEKLYREAIERLARSDGAPHVARPTGVRRMAAPRGPAVRGAGGAAGGVRAVVHARGSGVRSTGRPGTRRDRRPRAETGRRRAYPSHRAGVPDRPAGRHGRDIEGGGHAAVPEPAHHRRPPAEHLPQARHHLAPPTARPAADDLTA